MYLATTLQVSETRRWPVLANIVEEAEGMDLVEAGWELSRLYVSQHLLLLEFMFLWREFHWKPSDLLPMLDPPKRDQFCFVLRTFL